MAYEAFIHRQLGPIAAKMSLLDKIMFLVVHMLDKVWHRLPVMLGLAYLGFRRHLHYRYNLIQVGNTQGKNYDLEEYSHRTPDGT
ncbi:hypothetical protein Leryth_002991 [Lithospermum erythrorhizon]|nr:hypothetical protein Leryth_002991 [Lithospermum erythrorhizon]